MNRTGPAPPPRGFQGFGQANPGSRNLQLGTGRLQNTNKLGNGTTWGLGGVNGAPGLPSQSRPTGSNTTFAQSIAGSQPATPLDLSEFPSLSGAPQTQYQNPGQAVWGNPTQRTTQHTPVQRPQQHPISQQSNAQQPSQSQESPQQSREQVYTGSHMTSSNDDYHRGGQGGMGQLGASTQPQPTNVDEFPPLRRNGNDEDPQDRRGSLMQNAAFGGFPGSNTFSLPTGQDPTRHRLPSAQGGRSDSRTSTLVDRIMSPSALSFASSSNRQIPTSSANHESNTLPTPRTNQQQNINSLLDSFVNQQQAIGSSSRNAPPQQLPTRQQQGSQTLGGAAQTAENVPLDEMAPIDKWGLAGLLAKVRSDDPDTAALAIGQDLTQLGMDLNSPEPLHHTFPGPFGPPSPIPFQPTYTLPDCYTVDNVATPRHKLPGFADETLIWIFYFQPRDVMQEFAATELTNRNWRYHKEMQMWLTKDTGVGVAEPVVTDGGKAERGWYVFFNHRTWQRARTEFELRYEDLDGHIQVGEGRAMVGGEGRGMA